MMWRKLKSKALLIIILGGDNYVWSVIDIRPATHWIRQCMLGTEEDRVVRGLCLFVWMTQFHLLCQDENKGIPPNSVFQCYVWTGTSVFCADISILPLHKDLFLCYYLYVSSIILCFLCIQCAAGPNVVLQSKPYFS